MQTAFRKTDGNFMVIMNLDQYNYLRSLNIMKLPEYKDIDINSYYVWALNPIRIYVDGAALKRHLRLFMLANAINDKWKNDEMIRELDQLLNYANI